jgi:hypothetical protein
MTTCLSLFTYSFTCFPVLFNYSSQTQTTTVTNELIVNEDFQIALHALKENQGEREALDEISFSLRAEIEFTDVHGKVWRRDRAGKVRAKG